MTETAMSSAARGSTRLEQPPSRSFVSHEDVHTTRLDGAGDRTRLGRARGYRHHRRDRDHLVPADRDRSSFKVANRSPEGIEESAVQRSNSAAL